MTSTRIRWFLFPLAGLLLSGCSMTTLNIPATGEAKLFAQGLDQYIASGELTTLEQLPQKYPQGEWQLKAERIIGMVEQLQQQQTRLDKNNQELVQMEKENVALNQDIKRLEKTINQLKEVLIDTELQPK